MAAYMPLSVIISIVSFAIAYFLFQSYKARSAFYYSKVKRGLPMPKWNPIFGHLLVLDKVFKEEQIPPGIQMPDAFARLSRDFDEKSNSLFYLDLWPFTGQLMLVSSPGYANQAELALDRPSDLLWSLHPIAGGPCVFNTNGSIWKEAKNVFSTGFNANYIMSQMSEVLDEADVLIQMLKQCSMRRELIKLDEVIGRYTMDISGRMTLNQKLHAQTQDNTLASAMKRTLDWHYLASHKSSLVRRTPLIRLIGWYNGRIMNNYLSRALDERYAELRSKPVLQTSSKSAMDLLLVDYIIQHKGHVGSKVDTKFMTKVIPELRLMFFLGHDSTTSAICYSVYLLSQNASALAKVRSEHDEVFGTDLEATSRILREQSHLINQLPYTTALIKEALRLFTPASGFWAGEPDLYLHDEQGNRYPTEDTRIWILHSVLHRNPNYWKDPTSFIPERFLVGPDDPLYPPKGAWRPFEHGPRRCFGENLAMMDIKVTLVMLLRRFDFKDAYEEWDQMQGRSKEKVHRFEGERAYQVGQGAAHPADGLPCRVSLREKC